MNRLPERRTADLRKGRFSLPHARYFVTCCAVRPADCLIDPTCSRTICDVLQRLESDGDVNLLCATIMPDHFHLLFVLGTRLTLHRVVGKMKGLTEKSLRRAGARWQKNFHEHRLRPDELAESFGRYVFMNPYRAGLLGRRTSWQYWLKGHDFEPSWLTMLEDGSYPPGEWLTESLETMGVYAEAVGED